jgi:hypothetical protein
MDSERVGVPPGRNFHHRSIGPVLVSSDCKQYDRRKQRHRDDKMKTTRPRLNLWKSEECGHDLIPSVTRDGDDTDLKSRGQKLHQRAEKEVEGGGPDGGQNEPSPDSAIPSREAPIAQPEQHQDSGLEDDHR